MTNKPTVVLMANDKKSCNISCTHCYLPYEGSIPAEDLLQMSEKLRDDYKVTIAGSETLMDVNYLSSYKNVGQKFILTNGILLDKDPTLYNKLKENGISEIRMSLHFNIEKDLKSVPHRLVERVVKAAKAEGLFVHINTTITPENYNRVIEMCGETHRMGANKIEFIKYIKSGSAHEEKRSLLSDEERSQFFSLVDQARAQYLRDSLFIKIHGNFGPKPGSKGEALACGNTYCPAGVDLFVVAPDKQVYGCPLLMEHPIGFLDSQGRIQITKVLGDGLRDKCLTDIIL